MQGIFKKEEFWLKIGPLLSVELILGWIRFLQASEQRTRCFYQIKTGI